MFNLRLQYITEDPIASALKEFEITLVIDVGANIGQFGKSIRGTGYSGIIYSFEPLIDAHEQLLKNTNQDKNWLIHNRCAVGDMIGDVAINVAANSYSSSIKEMLPSHLNAAPDSGLIGFHGAQVITLDSLLKAWEPHKGRIFLKIDTQGFEQEVLKGAAGTLDFVAVVQVELSLTELYKGQALYDYFFSFFDSLGFVLHHLIPGFIDPLSGQLLQFDAVFLKKCEQRFTDNVLR